MSTIKQKYTLSREGFSDIQLRRIELLDGTEYYEMLAYKKSTPPTGWTERWEKIHGFSNEQIKDQIFKYCVSSVE